MAEDMNGKLFFLKLGEETRRISCSENELSSVEDLEVMAKTKFSDKSILTKDFEFWTTDKTYGVRYKVGTLQDIHAGSVIEIISKDQNKKRTLEDPNLGQVSKRARSGPRFVVRLRGLPWSCSKGDLTEFFEGIDLLEAHIINLPNGRASGEGVVEVGNQEDLEKALAKNKEHIGTRYIEVQKSTGEDMDRSLGRYKAATDNAVENEQNSVIRMRGMPFSSGESDIIEFFEQESVKPVRVHIAREGGVGRPSGVAFVEFSTPEESETAMKCNRKNMGSRYIELFKSDVNDLKKTMGYFSYRAYNPAMSGGQNGGYGSFGGERSGDGNNCIKMRGLPYSSTEQDITSFFQEAGITPVTIHRKPDGGEAYVEFSNENDAKVAMGRNKAHIGKRYIDLFRVNYAEVAQTVGL